MEELQKEEIVEKTEEERTYCVYMHTNKTNGKVYVGITSKKPEKRWGKNGCEYDKKTQRAFAGAIEKYGWDGFIHDVLFDNLTKSKAIQKEIELISLYKANVCRWGKEAMGYNMTDGGEGHSGHKHSEETRKKMSQSAKKRCTDEWRRQLGEFMRGRWVGDKSPNYGKPLSEETRKRISEAKKKKAVIQLSLSGDFVAKFESLILAERQTNISHSEIGKCCKGINKSAGGFIWVYQDSYNIKNDYYYVNSNCIPVVQFTLDGKFISVYESAAEAERKTSTCGKNILQCCRNELKSANHYLWRFKATYDDTQVIKYIRDDVRPVVQIDKQGLLVSEYFSISEAAKLFNVAVNSIIACCKGKAKSCKGFMWKYKEEYNSNEAMVYSGKDIMTPVVQLSLNGEFLHEYQSATEASYITGIDRRNISGCCCNQQKSAGGYIWVKKINYDPLKNYIYKHSKKRPVVKLTPSGEFVKEYESAREAERNTRVSHGEILICCKNQQRTAGGFKWMHKEDYEKQLQNLN
jgi:group I intron endonuclease